MIPIILDESSARTVILALSESVEAHAHQLSLDIVGDHDYGYCSFLRDELRILLDVMDEIDTGLIEFEADPANAMPGTHMTCAAADDATPVAQLHKDA